MLPSGRALDSATVTFSAAQVIDAATNEVEQISYIDHSSREGFISPASRSTAGP